MKDYVFSFIPAKEKSSNLKNKNLLKIYNKTLLELAIISSLKSKLIDITYISSESKKIEKISRLYDCVFIKRPSYLSKKNTKGIKVVEHFLKYLNRKIQKLNPIIIILQPTSPLRTVKDISRSIKIFKNKKLNFLISVSKNHKSPYKDMTIKNKTLIPLFASKNIFENRQSFPDTYKANGAIFIFRYKEFIKKRNFFNKCYPYIMNKISSLDVDNLDDFKLAKKYFKKVHGKKF